MEHLFLSLRHLDDIILKMRSQQAETAGIESINETILKTLTHLRLTLFKIKCHLLLVVLHSLNSSVL